MALLHEAVEFKKLDTRLVERNLTRGVITRKEFDDSVKNLPDDSENAEWVNIEILATETGEKETPNGRAHSVS